MIFSGIGIVRQRGKVIARFIDGRFETQKPGVIARLQALRFPQIDAHVTPQPAQKPAAKKKARK